MAKGPETLEHARLIAAKMAVAEFTKNWRRRLRRAGYTPEYIYSLATWHANRTEPDMKGTFPEWLVYIKKRVYGELHQHFTQELLGATYVRRIETPVYFVGENIKWFATKPEPAEAETDRRQIIDFVKETAERSVPPKRRAVMLAAIRGNDDPQAYTAEHSRNYLSSELNKAIRRVADAVRERFPSYVAGPVSSYYAGIRISKPRKKSDERKLRRMFERCPDHGAFFISDVVPHGDVLGYRLFPKLVERGLLAKTRKRTQHGRNMPAFIKAAATFE